MAFDCRHVDELLHRADLFVLAFRATQLTRGHHTNNFCEATMRVFKEVVLER